MNNLCALKIVEKITILGNFSDGHVGRHLATAAQFFDVDASCVDSQAMYGKGLIQKLSWHFFDRKPLHISRVLKSLKRTLSGRSCHNLLVVGLVPLPAQYIEDCRDTGVRCGIFLTDDPFNPKHRSKSIVRALPAYDVVFTPRNSIVPNLVSIGVKRTQWLPFGFDPAIHVARIDDITSEAPADVMFVGGADADRVPFAVALVEAGFTLALYGGYWETIGLLQPYARGILSASETRCAARSAKMQVVLVRRANRDGHVMRSYEAAASRSCLIVEDTDEHRNLFGEDGDCVAYFTSPQDLVSRVQALACDEGARSAMADRAFAKIVSGSAATYADRLRTVQAVLNEH